MSLFERSIKCIIALSVKKRLREATQRAGFISTSASSATRRDTRGKKKKGEIMRESRGETIIARQGQCGTCQSERLGFCILGKKRFCDMDIWQDCQDYHKKRGLAPRQ